MNTMSFKNQHFAAESEKLYSGDNDSSTTLEGLENFNLEAAQSLGLSDDNIHQGKSRITRWIWLLHGVLLSTSFASFFLAYNVQLSTLNHVKRFSAYCKHIKPSRL